MKEQAREIRRNPKQKWVLAAKRCHRDRDHRDPRRYPFRHAHRQRRHTFAASLRKARPENRKHAGVGTSPGQPDRTSAAPGPEDGRIASLVVPVLLGPCETPDNMLTSRAYNGLAKMLEALRHTTHASWNSSSSRRHRAASEVCQPQQGRRRGNRKRPKRPTVPAGPSTAEVLLAPRPRMTALEKAHRRRLVREHAQRRTDGHVTTTATPLPLKVPAEDAPPTPTPPPGSPATTQPPTDTTTAAAVHPLVPPHPVLPPTTPPQTPLPRVPARRRFSWRSLLPRRWHH